MSFLVVQKFKIKANDELNYLTPTGNDNKLIYLLINVNRVVMNYCLTHITYRGNGTK